MSMKAPNPNSPKILLAVSVVMKHHGFPGFPLNLVVLTVGTVNRSLHMVVE